MPTLTVVPYLCGKVKEKKKRQSEQEVQKVVLKYYNQSSKTSLDARDPSPCDVSNN